MGRRSLALLGVLLVALVAVSVVVNRDSIQSVASDTDISLSADESQYILGQTLVFTGSLAFADGETAAVSRVRLLNTQGPQGLDIDLPVADTADDFIDISTEVSGTLLVDISLNNVVSLGGTLPGGTLPDPAPGTSLPSGGNFTGLAGGGSIDYVVKWTPPVMLDPAPVFTLIPQTDSLFSIPLVAPPVQASGTILPASDLNFTVPTVGAPTGTALPQAEFAFNVPTVTVETNATTSLPDLPDTKFATTSPTDVGGFDIPDLLALGLIASAPSGVQDFPDTTAAFDIPDLVTEGAVPSAPAGVTDLPEAGVAFPISGSPAPRGLGTDGSNFWVVEDGTGTGGVDRLVKLGNAGTSTTSPSILATIDGPSSDLEGVAFANGHLWVVENLFRCFDDIDTARCDRSHRIFKIDPSDPPNATTTTWATTGKAVAIINAPDTGVDVAGIAVEGSGTSASLWLVDGFGFTIYNISQTGSEISTVFPDRFVPNMDGVAFSNNTLYTIDSVAARITLWTKSGHWIQQFDVVQEGTATAVSGIRGMTFKTVSSKDVLYLGSSDGNVYDAFFAPAVTTDPKGITFSPSSSAVGEALWILVDAEPKDKLMKVSTSTGALVSSFGTSGAVDAPSNKTEGITFLDGNLWIVANEDFNATLYKVNASTGALTTTYDLTFTASIFDELGGITNDGTNLVVHTKSFYNSVFVLNTTGQLTGDGQAFPCCPSFNGGRGLAFNTGRSQYFVGRNDTVGTYSDSFEFQQEYSLMQSGSPLSNIEGATFDGNILYVAHATGKISKTFLATTVTTAPRGIAFTDSASTAGGALWILVDAEPKDKLLKISTSTGTLITSFGTNGFVDAPTNKTEGITFLDTGDPSTSYLWIVSNEFDRKLYKINITTGAVVGSPFNLNATANIFDDIGGIASDGTDLILYFKSFNETVKIDPSNGFEVERSFFCCPNAFGAKGFARHSSRDQYFAAKDASLLTLDSSLQNLVKEQTLQVDSSIMTGDVEGLVFDQDVLYVAYKEGTTGKVSRGALRVTVGTDPRALAFSPSSSVLSGVSIGRALWILVDGDPLDKILKVDPSTGALDTSFGTSGVVDAQTNKIEGMTFLDGYLWLASNESFDRKLYKVKATDGSLSQIFNVGGGFSGFIFDDIGGLSNDGTDLMAFLKPFNDLVIIDTSGNHVETRFGCCSFTEGATAAAFRTGAEHLLAARDTQIVQYNVAGSSFDSVDEFTVVDATSTLPLADVQGLTFDMGTAGDVTDDLLYIADKSSPSKIYTAAIPSDVTNNPRGLAYDSATNELYILVDGKAADHIVVVDANGTSSPSVIRDFETPDSGADAITFLDGSLWVASRDDQFCCPPPTIYELNSTTGAVLGQITPDVFDKILGMSNDGTSLIVTPEFGGPHAVFIDPVNGHEVNTTFFFDPFNPFGFFEEGFQALAFATTSEEFFPVKNGDIFRFDEDGRLLEEFTLSEPGFDRVKGSVFAGDTLYMAGDDDGTNVVRSAGIPLPDITITNDPRGMATDGTDLYVVVDATPVDKILKVKATSTPGDLVTSFGTGGAVDSPGRETDGMAFHNGDIYVVTNDERTVIDDFGGFFVDSFPVIHQIDAATGEELAAFDIRLEFFDPFDPFAPPELVFDHIGALASDGTFLYAGVKGIEGPVGIWYKIDPQDPFNVPPAEIVGEFAGILPFIPGFEAMEFTPGSEFPDDRSLLASGEIVGGVATVIGRFDRDTGVMFDQYDLTDGAAAKDVKGMAYATSTRTMYFADDATNSILGTALPENTGIEITAVGSYDVQLQVDADSLTVSSPVVLYSLIRNDDVVLELTAPADDFVFTGATITISGRINDPSTTQVQVGIELPFTEFVNDAAISGVSENIWMLGTDGGSAVWHIACSDASPGFPDAERAASSPCSWRYGLPDGANFDTGTQTFGDLTTMDIITVSVGSELTFHTAHATELSAGIDVKAVEIAIVTTDLQGNDVVGEYRPVVHIVGKGGGFEPPPPNAEPTFQYFELDPLFINPNLMPVNVDLSPYANQRIKVRFRFDSVDDIANDGEGWYLDDIVISGSGTETVQVATTPLDPPVVATVNGTTTTMFRSFSQSFVLAEGKNTLIVSGTQSYTPFKVGIDQVEGFVDTTAPQVTLGGIPSTTNSLVQTLTGTVEDDTLQSLIISQITFDGGSTSTQTIFSLSSVPADGTFSVPVSMVEGLNEFEAVAIDGGNLSSLTMFEAIGDITPPGVSDDGAIFPVGAVSARAGDELIFQVTADDGIGAVSGVEKVELIVEGVIDDELLPADQIPSIVRSQFGITGNFVLFTEVPEGVPPGKFSIEVRVTDNAGNTADTTVSGDVTAALQAQNIFLFEGANLVGINLQDTNATPTFAIDDVLAQQLDTSVLDASFASSLTAALANTVTTSTGIAGGSVVDVASVTDLAVGDRIAVGSGDTTLTADASAGDSVVSVADTTGFGLGQTIVFSGAKGSFGLGYSTGFATSSITAISTTTLTLSPSLSATHFDGARVTGVQHARVASVSGTTVTVDGTFVIEPPANTVVAEEAKLGDVMSAIFFFTGGVSVGAGSTQGVFQQFIPGVGGDLTVLNQGRSYWFITKAEAFDRSDPLPGFLEGPIIPVVMQLDGVLFDPTGSPPSLPATVELDKAGWHQIALISEQDRTVENGVRGLIVGGASQFTSLNEFQKFIEFDSESGEVEIIGGVFNPLFVGDIANPGDIMQVGRGFYIFMTEPGTHTP